jgi:hypothetical protein
MDAVEHEAHVEQLEPLAAVLVTYGGVEDSLAVGLAVSRRLVGCPANRWPGVLRSSLRAASRRNSERAHTGRTTAGPCQPELVFGASKIEPI